MTVAAVPQTYTVTHAGVTAKIVRRDVPDHGDHFGARPLDTTVTSYLIVEDADGLTTLCALDSAERGMRRINGAVHLTAAFLIGDDLPDALARATKYAVGICQVVADHRAALVQRNDINAKKVTLARTATGAQ